MKVRIQGFIFADPHPPQVVVTMPCVDSRRSSQHQRRSARGLDGGAPRCKLNFNLRRHFVVHSPYFVGGFLHIEPWYFSARNAGHAHTDEGFVFRCGFPYFSEVVKIREPSLERSEKSSGQRPFVQVMLVGYIRYVDLAKIAKLK